MIPRWHRIIDILVGVVIIGGASAGKSVSSWMTVGLKGTGAPVAVTADRGRRDLGRTGNHDRAACVTAQPDAGNDLYVAMGASLDSLS